ncbi:MAG: OB-fold domain-containing protein, partial [Oscillospiraceae bacterium]|nr:OB-fold domain-containing protein [Oscillospiraceae bacterium]
MKANIYSYTVIRSTTEAFVPKLPYVVALLEDEGGRRFTAFVEGYEEGMALQIGQTVAFSHEDEAGR